MIADILGIAGMGIAILFSAVVLTAITRKRRIRDVLASVIFKDAP